MAKKAVSKKRAKSTSARLPEKAGAKKVTGTVLKIVNGKPSDEKLSAERAFTDLDALFPEPVCPLSTVIPILVKQIKHGLHRWNLSGVFWMTHKT